jgi:hypothetical protein
VRACLRRPEFQIVESEAAETLQPVGVEAEGPRAEHRVEEEPADSSGVDVNKTCWWRGWLRRRVTLPRIGGIDSRWPRRKALPPDLEKIAGGGGATVCRRWCRHGSFHRRGWTDEIIWIFNTGALLLVVINLSYLFG